MYEFDDSQWSSIIWRPSLWWRIKALFCGAEVIFCWGQDRYMVGGIMGEEYVSAGNVPVSMRERARHGGRYRDESASVGGSRT